MNTKRGDKERNTRRECVSQEETKCKGMTETQETRRRATWKETELNTDDTTYTYWQHRGETRGT